MTEIRIKNMVCGRCIKTVTNILKNAGLEVQSVQLGKAVVADGFTKEGLETVRHNLAAEGFDFLDDQRSKLVEGIKNEIINLVHYGELDEMRENLSHFLSGKLNKDYNHLSNLFSSVENTTIEQYFILQKIEKAKEMLVYDLYSLSQIAYKLGYSSVAHLSGQFKRVTGFTPSQFKQLNVHHRKHIDKI
jgi:AraC-like DNA-binding protein